MSWPKWILVSIQALLILMSIFMIGKPRTPSTPGVVAVSTMISATMIWLVVIA